MDFRGALTVFGAVVIAAATSVPMYGQDRGQAPSQGTPQPPQERKKLSKEDLASYDTLNTLVNNVIAGKQPAPADAKLTFHNHFLKSSQNIYIPYTVDVEPGKLTNGPVAMYVRAVSKNPTAVAAAADKAKTNARGGNSTYAFEDVYILPEVGAQVDRAMELPGGEYDLYIAMAERPKDKKLQATAKSVVFTQPLSVPDPGTALTTSSVILAKSIDTQPKQLTGQEQLENPYTISGYKIVPRFTNTIPKAEELLFLFFVYNEGTAASGKPDLDVDYTFARASEEKPFSKLATTSFNSTTLPAEFDISKGHQVFVGQGIPLTSFAPGDYKLEIKINDKTNSSTVTRNVPFTVTP
jgi:hypothetical protein